MAWLVRDAHGGVGTVHAGGGIGAVPDELHVAIRRDNQCFLELIIARREMHDGAPAGQLSRLIHECLDLVVFAPFATSNTCRCRFGGVPGKAGSPSLRALRSTLLLSN